jgi:hypothetical protein
MSQVVDRLFRVLKLLVAVLAAAVLVYRSHTYNESAQLAVWVPLMCGVSALLLVVTAAVVICQPKSDETTTA